MAREKISIQASQACRFHFKTSESLTADRVITISEIEAYNGFLFVPTAARNVDLPAEASCKGVFLFIKNNAGGAYALTIRDDAAGTVATLTQGQACVLVCDGVLWWEVTS